jgi:hypothetical protein
MKLGKPYFNFTVVFTSLVAACLAVGCKKSSDSGDAGPGLGVGMTCQSSNDCRTHLVCDTVSKTCRPASTVIAGGGCTLSSECLPGNYCSQRGGVCAQSGTGVAGSVCSSEGDCASGLLCSLTGLTGVCQQPGAGDVGRGCTQTSECMAGLVCVTGVCAQAFTKPWSGVACPAEEKTARVLFHVPRASDLPSTDFYRLPFPNDARLKNGKVSLAGFPKPGNRILPFDIVQRYVDAIETDLSGFGANQAVYFRFSRSLNTDVWPPDCSANMLDITPGSPTYGLTPGFDCHVTLAQSAYICGPNLWVRPPSGLPLRPGTTYAVLIRKGLVDLAGAPFTADDDFTAMLGVTAPSDPELAAAWAVYKPLRDYMAATKMVPEDLIGGTVFTVQKYEDTLAAIDHSVASLPAPSALAASEQLLGIKGLVHCGEPGAVSPCDDRLTGDAHVRGCLPEDSADPSFDTYQGLIALPVFQKGKAPYLEPEDGGNIEFDALSDGGALVSVDAGGPDGGVTSSGPAIAAAVQRTENVCFSLTVPKGAAPPTGWPLVVYAHGTGGSYRSILTSGLAQDFAGGKAPAGLHSTAGAIPVPMATLGYDGVMHGTRAAGSTKSTGELVYNFLNPRAARDNALQEAADLFAIPRVAAGFAGLGIPIDAKRLALYGHSQGGNGASLVAARQSAYKTIVMSGTGGFLIQTLLGKTKPVDVPAVLPYLLGEASGDPKVPPLDASHSVLNLMQMYFERSDSVNFGRRVFKEPLSEMTPHHVLHVYGTGDSYSVVPTQRAYAISVGLRVAAPVVDPFGLATVMPPVWNDEDFGPFDNFTAVEIQYNPDATEGYDGHFVSTRNPAARAAIQQMLVTTFRDGIPTVSP